MLLCDLRARGHVGLRRDSWRFLLLLDRLNWMQDWLWDEIAEVHGCYQVLLVTLLLLFNQSVVVLILSAQSFLPRLDFLNGKAIGVAWELYLFIMRIIEMEVALEFCFLLDLELYRFVFHLAH